MKRRNAKAKLMWGFKGLGSVSPNASPKGFAETEEYDEVDLDDPESVKAFCDEWNADLYWVIYRKQRRKK